MMEKIKAKFEQAKQWVSNRFNLDTRFGVVMADTELGAMVVGREIGKVARVVANTARSEWQEFRESPKEYVKSKWEKFSDKFKVGKEKLIGKFEEIRNNLREGNKVERPFEDRLYSWYKEQSEKVFEVEAKITENLMAFEMEKIKLTLGDDSKEKIRNIIFNRIKELKNKREMFIYKAEKQKAVGFFFEREMLAFA